MTPWMFGIPIVLRKWVLRRAVENGIPPEDIFVERNGEQIPYSALVKEVEI